MPKSYRQLTLEQRCQIYALKESGNCQASISRHLGVSRSTISRELKRNKDENNVYDYSSASQKAQSRRSRASRRLSKFTSALRLEIELLLLQHQWSPEQISGWLKKEGKPSVSPTRIYQHIWADKQAGGELYKSLRHSGKKYCQRKGKTAGRGLIPGRVDIDQRPAIVEEKSRIGDWEADTIIGAKHSGVIFSCVDRKSKFTKLVLLDDRTAGSVTIACQRALLPIADKVITITYDNGKEFANHVDIGKMLGASSYFAKPYHSWERGLNEHTNGLARQYFPKGTDFATLTRAEVQAVEDKLNSRPRKVLGYKTPREIFYQAVKQEPVVALRA
jgi:transposase, IS30 family